MWEPFGYASDIVVETWSNDNQTVFVMCGGCNGGCRVANEDLYIMRLQCRYRCIYYRSFV